MMMLRLTPSASCRFPVPARPACDSRPSDWAPPAPAALYLQHRSCVGVIPGPSGNPFLPWRSLRLLRPAVQSSQSQAAVDVNKETGGDTKVAEAAAGADVFTCVWGDFFVNYSSSPSQTSEEWMIERANELKGQVRQMFVTGKDMSVADMLSLVDTLKRLGIDNHFRGEIDVALSRIHSEEQDYFDGCSDMHVLALGFCILRQHGFWVSTDVFDKFRDATGNFSMDLTTDTRGLLSMYNAAHMAVPGEVILDDVIAFARRHLEAAKGKLRSPMVEQVSRALEIPRPRFMPQLETMHYITEYEQEEAHNSTILELASIDFNIVRSLYIKELKNLSLWWRPLYHDVKLTYTRNCIVEAYFYTSGVLPEEENSRGRIILAKVLPIMTLVDDTYDTHATLEQCQIFTEAIERWDESVVPILPEYLRMLYIKLLRNIKEIEDILEPWEKNRMAIVQTSIKLLCKNYLIEAEWFSRNYTPSFKEHIDLSVSSTCLAPFLLHVALMGAGQLATKEAFDWALNVPDMVKAMGEAGRFLNDISAYYKPRSSKKDMDSSLECYMKEHGVTPEDATAALATMGEHAWRRINQAYMELDRGILPAAQVVVNMARMHEVIYLHGSDAFSFGGTLKDTIASLLLKDFPS